MTIIFDSMKLKEWSHEENGSIMKVVFAEMEQNLLLTTWNISNRI